MSTRRWLFADQLGPQFLDDPAQPVLLVESAAVFRRRRFHRMKAHLLLSGLRHRAAELGDQVQLVRADTYDEALEQVDGPLSVVQPTSYAADRFVRSRGLEVVADDRGFATTREDFAGWVQGRKRLLMEDFYRWQRRRLGYLMDGDEPVAGRWNFDDENRERPPKSGNPWPDPQRSSVDDLDRAVLDDLPDDCWGAAPDGTWATTRSAALSRLPEPPVSNRRPEPVQTVPTVSTSWTRPNVAWWSAAASQPAGASSTTASNSPRIPPTTAQRHGAASVKVRGFFVGYSMMPGRCERRWKLVRAYCGGRLRTMVPLHTACPSGLVLVRVRRTSVAIARAFTRAFGSHCASASAGALRRVTVALSPSTLN